MLIAILVICLLGSFVFRKNALAVVVNNNTIGYIKDTSTTEDEFKQLITAKLKETVGNELEINESIKLKPVTAYLSTLVEILKKLFLKFVNLSLINSRQLQYRLKVSLM